MPLTVELRMFPMAGPTQFMELISVPEGVHTFRLRHWLHVDTANNAALTRM